MTSTSVTSPDLTDWFREAVTSRLGFTLGSTSDDPAHLLHQFIKGLTSDTEDHLALLRILTASLKQSPASGDAVVARAGELGIAIPTDGDDLWELRKLLHATVASDNLVFKDQGSVQLAALGSTGKNSSARGLANLFVALVVSDDQARECAAAAMQKLDEPQPNGFWLIEKALTKQTDPPIPLEIVEDVEVPDWFGEDDMVLLVSASTRLLRNCLRLVALGDSLQGTRILALSLTWLSSVLAVQLPSLWLRGAMHPLIVDVRPSLELPSVRRAAHKASFEGVARLYESWIQSLLEDRIRSDWAGLHVSREGLREYIDHATPLYAGKVRRDTERDTRMAKEQGLNTFETLTSEDDEVGQIREAATVLRRMVRAGLSPELWVANQARSCGFLYPRRKGDKRFTIESTLLPVLLLASFEEGEREMRLPELLLRLRRDFGLVIGPDEVDDDIDGAPLATELDLNVDELARALVGAGLARAYGDKVTDVVNPLARLNGSDNGVH